MASSSPESFRMCFSIAFARDQRTEKPTTARRASCCRRSAPPAELTPARRRRRWLPERTLRSGTDVHTFEVPDRWRCLVQEDDPLNWVCVPFGPDAGDAVASTIAARYHPIPNTHPINVQVLLQGELGRLTRVDTDTAYSSSVSSVSSSSEFSTRFIAIFRFSKVSASICANSSASTVIRPGSFAAQSRISCIDCPEAPRDLSDSSG